MKTISFDYDEIHDIVEAKKNWFWDGWTVVIIDPRRNGSMHPNGIYMNGKWALQTRVEPNEHGLWEVPVKNV